MMIPLVVDHYEHNDLIIELKEMDQNGLTKSRNSMKVCIFKPSLVGTPQFFSSQHCYKNRVLQKMFQTIKSKVTDISNKTDGKISEVDQSSDQKWQTLGRLVEDLSNKVKTICFPSEVLAHLHMTLIEFPPLTNWVYLRTTFVTSYFCPRTFLECFILDSCCSKAKHCRND